MISIIIPVYNQSDKIGRTFDSIINQTYQELEVIVVNDGSTDGIEKVVEKYQSKFEEANIIFKYFSQERKWAPAARNHGWKESKGEYLFFCDADSHIEPRALEAMLKTLNDYPEASYAYSSFLWGSKLFRVGEFSADRLKQAPFIHTMALIRREHFPVSGWDESIVKLQDWDLWLTMLSQGRSGVWIDQVLFAITPGGVYSNWLPSFCYKLLPWLPKVKKYNRAVEIIKKKHKL